MANNNTGSNTHDIDRAWELMKRIGYAMLVTRDGEKLRARPMAAFVEHDEGAVYFLADARHHADDEVARSPVVNLSFADTGGQKYVSVSGKAVVSNDRDKIHELFATPARAWWDNADDPNIRLLKVTPDEAEFWDSPGTLVTYVKMAAAAVTGTRPAVGDKRKVAM
jgi:general stress protein 26